MAVQTVYTVANMPEASPQCADYLKWLSFEKRLSAKTIASYTHDLEMLCALVAQQPWQAITTKDIRRFIAKLHAGGLGGRSLARALSVWRGYFHWLCTQLGFALNPCNGVKAPRYARRLPTTLSPEQAHTLLESEEIIADEKDPWLLRDRAMFELFYSSGLRLSELAGLRMEAAAAILDGEVTVIGKGQKMRMVPVGSRAQQAVALWMKARSTLTTATEATAPLFINARGAHVSVRTIQRRLADCARKAGLPLHVHPHMLRHSFASHLLQSSGDLRAVQELLGHRNIRTTQIYTHLDFQHLSQVYDQAHPRARNPNAASPNTSVTASTSKPKPSEN